MPILRRVWGGDATGEFYEHWVRPADRLEQTFDTGRRLKALLDERLDSLRMRKACQDFTRAILEIAGTSVQGRSEGPKQIPQRLPGTTFQAMRHAEANAIMEAKLKGLTGSHATLYVDQLCAAGADLRSLRVVDATGDLGELLT